MRKVLETYRDCTLVEGLEDCVDIIWPDLFETEADSIQDAKSYIDMVLES